MYHPPIASFKALFFEDARAIACVARCTVRGEWARAVQAIEGFQPVISFGSTAGGCAALGGLLFVSWEALAEVDPNAPANLQLQLEREGGEVRLTLPLKSTLGLQVALLMDVGADFALQYAFSSRMHNPANDFANARLEEVLRRICPPHAIRCRVESAPDTWGPRLTAILTAISRASIRTKDLITKAMQERSVHCEEPEFWRAWNGLCAWSGAQGRTVSRKRVRAEQVGERGARRLEGMRGDQMQVFHEEVRWVLFGAGP